MWFPPQPCLIFFGSTSPAPPTDLTLIDFFILLLFFQLTPTSSTSPPTLLLIQPFSVSVHISYSPLSFYVFLPIAMDVTATDFYFFLFSLFSLCFFTHVFLCISPTRLCHFLPVVNVLISSCGRVRDKCRLRCRMANNYTTLIAILHSVFRNNQIRESVCVNAYACGRMCAHQPEIVPMSAENCRSTLAISFLLSEWKYFSAADFA